ncbi:MAG: AAA family ATPase [Myxococcota bacterium]
MSSAKKKSLRVYFVTHEDRRLSGVLMRTRESFFEGPPPSAYGATEADVLQHLEVLLRTAIATNEDFIERYLWDEEFHTRSVQVRVNPASVVKKQPVIGVREVPMRVSFCWSKTSSGAYRVVLPRFGWWMILEDLEIAPKAIQNDISSALLGADEKWLYDFRSQGEEYVRAWSPSWGIESSPVAASPSAELAARYPVMAAVADEWVERARQRKLPNPIGDDAAFDMHWPKLVRDDRPSTVLVGEPGVGKTTFIQRFAYGMNRMARTKKKRAQDDSPIRLWMASADRILAGMVYLGMWQERVLSMIDELSHEGHYLYVDHLTGILEKKAGRAAVADLLAPAIVDGRVSLLAECTESEWVRARRLAPELCDALSVIRLEEPKVAETYALLAAYQERAQGPVIDGPGLQRLVRHVSTFRRDQRLPGSALNFLDWLNKDSQRRTSLTARAVSDTFSRYAGMPVALLADELAVTTDVVSAHLQKGVIGQRDACDTAARVLVPLKAGLNNPDRPVGTLFFAGPTGVGKTELAKRLCTYMFGSVERMVRIDMSEYAVPGASQRLLEVGRGVSSLAEKIRQQPLSLVLLDEIEKAHSEVFDLLLGVLGEGRMTDSLGRTVDFRMTVIVMTSNLGVTRTPPPGFSRVAEEGYEGSVRAHFRPEFVGRLDHIVGFRRLDPDDIGQIVDLLLEEAVRRAGFRRKKISLVIEPSARRRLAELGYNPTQGARPLKRVVEERVVTPLAVRMAADPSLREQTIRVVERSDDPQVISVE